jgi:hypothetical protein
MAIFGTFNSRRGYAKGMKSVRAPNLNDQSHSVFPLSTLSGKSGLYLPTSSHISSGDMPQLVPERNRDEDSGRFQEEYPPEEVIAAIQRHGGYAGTADIAEEIGATTESAYAKLRAMEEENRVQSQLIGQSRIWEVTEED